jgi:hypothetical protein
MEINACQLAFSNGSCWGKAACHAQQILLAAVVL